VTRTILVAVSAAIFVVVWVSYLTRPDCCAAITVWPAWAWVLLGILLSVMACGGLGWKRTLAVVVLWLVCLVCLCEEPKSLVRGLMPGSRSGSPQGRVLRVVSLNCGVGNAAAANEVIGYHPDIVLLQESPGSKEVHALGRRLYGKRAGVAWGTDTSIIADGRVTAEFTGRASAICATVAHVVVRGKEDMEVLSIRLSPPVFRTDVWSPDNWREQASLRRTHSRELREVTRKILSLDRGEPMIVGGDFNMPAGDGALRELPRGLSDSFREGGVGWGDTVLNDVPVERYDQVWASREFRVLAVRAHRTRNSDHRIVVCDLALR
jgi:vancomycin resistance protein VanJ